MTSIPQYRKYIPFALLAASLVLPAALPAQSGAGTIQGTVQDSTGASIPNCSVHVLNQATSVTNDTTTNETGFYAVPGLFPGTYMVTFSAHGMKKYQTTVELQNAKVAVLDPKLTVGEVAEAASEGHREIQLLGQIVNHYQAPDDPGCDFAGLLEAVHEVTDRARIGKLFQAHRQGDACSIVVVNSTITIFPAVARMPANVARSNGSDKLKPLRMIRVLGECPAGKAYCGLIEPLSIS